VDPFYSILFSPGIPHLLDATTIIPLIGAGLGVQTCAHIAEPPAAVLVVALHQPPFLAALHLTLLTCLLGWYFPLILPATFAHPAPGFTYILWGLARRDTETEIGDDARAYDVSATVSYELTHQVSGLGTPDPPSPYAGNTSCA
jgi:hypothetical protein